MRIRYWLLLLLVWCTGSSQAQSGAALLWQGKVIDDKQQPLEFVTVVLVRAADQQAVESTLTNVDGEFVLHPTAGGPFHLVLRMVGYQPFKSEEVGPANRRWGTLVLMPSAKTLAEVQVIGHQEVMTAENGNLRLNVAASPSAAGQTAYDLLRRAPGVTIGRDNTISLNGKTGVRLLLNDKLVYLENADLVALLKTLPATSITNIDLLANPGVRYDAAGTAGLIHIHTQKGLAEGLNGTVTLGTAYWYTPKQNADLNLNYRRGRLNLYAAYNHQLGHYAYRYTLYREQLDTLYDSPTIDTDKRRKVNATLGADYELTEHQTLGLALSTNMLFGPGLTQTTTRIAPLTTRQTDRTLLAANDYYLQRNNRYNASLNYRWQLTPRRSFTAAADYGYFAGGSRNLQPNTYVRPNGDTLSRRVYRSLTASNIHLYAVQADFRDSIGQGEVSVGAKFSDIRSNNDYRFLRVEEQADVLDSQRSNRFAYHENIAAVYANYTVALTSRVGVQAGARVENTWARGRLTTASTAGQPLVRRNYLNVFPALTATYRPSDKRTVSASYGRRLDRPAYQNLNPFVTLLDELSFWQGNPLLRPQYASRFALDYATVGGLALTLAYTRTRAIIAQVNDTLEGNKVAMTPRNVGHQQHLSLTATRTFAPTVWWTITASATPYYVDNNLQYDALRRFRLRAFSGSLSVQQTFQLPWHGLSAELAGNYNAPTATSANERTHANGQLDLGVRRKVLGDAGSLSLSITDIFLTNIWNTRTSFEGFYLRSYGYGESRQVRLNFTYAFGNKQVAAPRDRKSALDTENGRIK